ncbi:MAG: phosphoribosylanthranilate isomerase [Gemmatimonadaceae bacterium]|jgi:phosphoribosylanthranilate isomerase|nr:phosphoribosylanthranilate isomerase [Gemmatimonadaceae bacterium]
MARRPAIKICGLTRGEDAARAAALGARYVGVVMAGGPRALDVAQAADVFRHAAAASRVVVFGEQSLDDIVRIADTLALDAVQLHGAATPDALAWLAQRTPAARWAVVRLAGDEWPAQELDALAAHAHALLLEAKVHGQLGGTGVPLPWERLAERVHQWRARWSTRQFILAGGLRATTVDTAIRWLSPDVVDVSSGIERTAGIKDPAAMRAFFDAVEHVHA